MDIDVADVTFRLAALEPPDGAKVVAWRAWFPAWEDADDEPLIDVAFELDDPPRWGVEAIDELCEAAAGALAPLGTTCTFATREVNESTLGDDWVLLDGAAT